MLSLLRTITLLTVTTHYIRHVQQIGFYGTMTNAWQLTLWSMHAAPIITLRLMLLPLHMATHRQERILVLYTAGVAWILHSLRCRNWNLRDPWTMSYILLEGAALFTTDSVILAARCLAALLVLQLVIVVGFWGGICVASFSDRFTFLPLDRHLHKGWRHLRTSAEAQKRLLHDMGGHGLMQTLFASALAAHLRDSTAIADAKAAVSALDAVGDAAVLCSAYAAIVLAVATYGSYELPYVRRRPPESCKTMLPVVALVVLVAAYHVTG